MRKTALTFGCPCSGKKSLVTISVVEGRSGKPFVPSRIVRLVTSSDVVWTQLAAGPKTCGLVHILASPPRGQLLFHSGCVGMVSLQPLKESSAYLRNAATIVSAHSATPLWILLGSAHQRLSRGSRHGRGGSPGKPRVETKLKSSEGSSQALLLEFVKR
eukprot:SAG31_NODE_44_length_31168_cov_16.507290_13_plen_159_part_00